MMTMAGIQMLLFAVLALTVFNIIIVNSNFIQTNNIASQIKSSTDTGNVMVAHIINNSDHNRKVLENNTELLEHNLENVTDQLSNISAVIKNTENK